MNHTIKQCTSGVVALPPLRAQFAGDTGAQAAHRLLEICWHHAGGSTTALAQFLIGLYNKNYASGDPASLCKWLDDSGFEDVVSTMRWIRANRHYEIHNIFTNGGEVMEELMQRFGLRPPQSCNG